MSALAGFAVFVLATSVSLAMSKVLVTGIEEFAGERALSEAALGMLAALCADAPEITSAVTALARHQQAVGAGIVVGSNVFNLAALLGLGALVAGRIPLHRRVVALAGSVAIIVATTCLLALLGTFSPALALLVSAAVLLPYLALCTVRPSRLERVPLPTRPRRWLIAASRDEQLELAAEVGALPHHHRSPSRRLLVTGGALVIVVAASVAMEQSATSLGNRYAVPEIVIGGIVLAAVTSLPNAVAAVYLARRGRGVAVLSTAFNSNAINVAVGFLLPATITGLHGASDHGPLVGLSYLGFTLFAVIAAWRTGALDRRFGWTIIAAYVVFVGMVVLVAT